MAQYKVGTVDVVNGSQTVTGTGTAWNTSSNVEAGDIFTVDQGVTWYEVGSVDSDTQITLTANFAGTTQNGISYAITRDFTTNLDLPYPNNQDIGTAGILRRALEEVDSLIGGGGGDVSFNDLTVNGLIDLANSGAIQDASTDAITFDGSQNVGVPNGNLDLSATLFLDANGGCIQFDHDADTGNNRGIFRILKDSNPSWDMRHDYNTGELRLDNGTNRSITLDQSANVDIPNGALSVGDNGTNKYLQTVHGAADTAIQFIDSSDTVIWEIRNDGSDFEINNGANVNQAIVIDASQNVDISNGGVTVGAPTGGNQGAGTINAEAVYDDGSLLTDYVFDAEIDGAIDTAYYDQQLPNKTRMVDGQETVIEREHKPAKQFDNSELDPASFSQKWRNDRKLPAIARKNEKPSIGELAQALLETCEVQAVHIAKLEERIRALENQ